MSIAVVVLAVLAALAGGAAIALAVRVRRLDRAVESASAEGSALRDALDERTAALTAADERAEAAERTAHEAETAVRAMEDERRVLDARATEVVAERDRLLTEVEQAGTELSAARQEAEDLRGEVTALQEKADRLRDEHRDGLDTTALWNLELARAERTWRHSVAVSPDQPSPFVDADDPLGVAVGVEVAALREEVGVAMELRWDATVDDLARRLLVLRMVQELLSAASRAEQAVVLSATDGDDGAVVLHLGVPEDNEPIDAVQLEGVEHLVTVDTSDGVRVTVH